MDFLIEQIRPPAQRDHILVRQVDWISLAQFEQPSQVIERAYLPEKTKRTEFIEGKPAEAAARLVEKLRFDARVI